MCSREGLRMCSRSEHLHDDVLGLEFRHIEQALSVTFVQCI